MHIQNDFKEFLRLLKAHDVDFVILGGYAVAFHGYVRNTQDLDILFRADDHGVLGVLGALRAFGFPEDSVSAADIARPGNVIRMGVPPVRIELLNTVSGVAFDEVWAGRIAGHYDDVPVAYIGRAELIRNKMASGRPKDLADVDELSRQSGSPRRRG
jgi:hypothetical protein